MTGLCHLKIWCSLILHFWKRDFDPYNWPEKNVQSLSTIRCIEKFRKNLVDWWVQRITGLGQRV